jgi:hypothetical protein
LENTGKGNNTTKLTKTIKNNGLKVTSEQKGKHRAMNVGARCLQFIGFSRVECLSKRRRMQVFEDSFKFMEAERIFGKLSFRGKALRKF